AIIIAVVLFPPTRQSNPPASVQTATESRPPPPPPPMAETPTSRASPAEPRAHTLLKPSPGRKAAAQPAVPLPESLKASAAGTLASIAAPAQPAAATPQQSAANGMTLHGASSAAGAPLAQTMPPQATAAASKTAPASTLRAYNAGSALRSPDGLAEIAGTITDSSGAAVPHAKVTLDQTAGTAHREALSDASGRFTISSLPPGKYRLG